MAIGNIGIVVMDKYQHELCISMLLWISMLLFLVSCYDAFITIEQVMHSINLIRYQYQTYIDFLKFDILDELSVHFRAVINMVYFYYHGNLF